MLFSMKSIGLYAELGKTQKIKVNGRIHVYAVWFTETVVFIAY